MKLSLAERIAVGITLAVLLFFAGWYARGRLTGGWYTVSGSRPAEVETEETEAAPAQDRTFVPDQRLDLNTATQEELLSLPGIGAGRAKAILEYRAEHGGFRTVQELLDVPGIGQGVYEGVKDYVTVEEAP